MEEVPLLQSLLLSLRQVKPRQMTRAPLRLLPLVQGAVEAVVGAVDPFPIVDPVEGVVPIIQIKTIQTKTIQIRVKIIKIKVNKIKDNRPTPNHTKRDPDIQTCLQIQPAPVTGLKAVKRPTVVTP